MERIYSELTASLTALKRNPSRVIDEANGAPVAILSHNKPKAYLLSPEAYKELLEAHEDRALAKLAAQRARESDRFVEVSVDEL